MILDMSNSEKAKESLIKLTGIEEDMLEEYIKYTKNINKSYDNMDIFLNIFKNVKLEDIKLEDIKVVGEHCTTNSDGCENIRKYGLKGLTYLLKNESELKTFLEENLLKNKSENLYDHLSKNKEEYGVDYRLTRDDSVNIFFMKDAYKNYCSSIKECPEFLATIDKTIKTNLRRIWENDKNKKTYIIRVLVPLEKFEIGTFIEEYNSSEKGMKYICEIKDDENLVEDLKKRIIQFLLCTYQSESINETIGHINGDVGIAKEEIIAIEEID